MKKKIILAALVLFVVIALATTVKAATEVTTLEELKAALVGTEETIQLKNDIDDTTSGLSMAVTGTKVLDLNGKTLTLNESVFGVLDEAKLTVNGNGKIITNGNTDMFFCLAGGELNLENGTFQNKYQGASASYAGRIINVTGTENDDGTIATVNLGAQATLISDYGYGIAIFEDSTAANGVKVTVEGTIKAKQMGITINGNAKATTGNVPVVTFLPTANIEATNGPAVYGAGYGIWNFEGGKFVGEEALSIKSGKFNIINGEFIANGTFYSSPIDKNNSGAESTGSAISITSNSTYAGKIEVIVDGDAIISSENGYAVFETITNGTQVKVDSLKLVQGLFEGKEGDVKSDNLEKFVEGGKYSKGVDAKYVSDNVKSAEIGGLQVYGESYTLTIDEDSKKYLSLDLSEAIEGQTVEVKINEEALEGKYKVKDIIVTYAQGSEVRKLSTTTFNMPAGDVTIKAVLEEVKAEDKEEVKNPQTGDNIVGYAVLFAIALVGISATVIIKKNNK